MNTDKADILFFIRREYGKNHPSIELRAYKAEKINDETEFRRIEYLRMYSFSGNYQTVFFEHAYGKDDCIWSGTKGTKELTEQMKKQQLTPIDRRNYERFRKVAIGIYRQSGIIDFTTLQTTPIKNV